MSANTTNTTTTTPTAGVVLPGVPPANQSRNSHIPIIPGGFAHTGTGFLAAADNSMVGSTLGGPGGRGLQQQGGGFNAAATATTTTTMIGGGPSQAQSQSQSLSPLLLLKPGVGQQGGKAGTGREYVAQGVADSAGGDGSIDPSRLKMWSAEETMELIRLYKKYLPEFHQFGQRKVHVWHRVCQEMATQGKGANFSWAECSAKFRSLRDSYRRSSAGSGRTGSQSWPYFAAMKDVMKMEKTLLEQDPGHKGGATPIVCPSDVAAVHGVSSMSPSLPPSLPLSLPLIPSSSSSTAAGGHPPPVLLGERAATQADAQVEEEVGHNKRVCVDAGAGPAAVKRKCSEEEQRREPENDQETSNNTSSEAASKGKAGRKAGGGWTSVGLVGVAGGSLESVQRSLSLPQVHLSVGEDGQVVQTTSTPTGLYLNEGGQLVSGHTGNPRHSGSGGAGSTTGGGGMPQWFKLYEKRSRAENSRRLEELRSMHRQTVELQRQTLEVAQHKNQLLKQLTSTLDQFTALLQHR